MVDRAIESLTTELVGYLTTDGHGLTRIREKVLRELREFSRIGIGPFQFVKIRAIRVKSPPHLFRFPIRADPCPSVVKGFLTAWSRL